MSVPTLAIGSSLLALTETFHAERRGGIRLAPPPDPREVGEAVAELVEAPADTRPERVSVDRLALGKTVEEINAATKPANDRLLTELGLAEVIG